MGLHELFGMVNRTLIDSDRWIILFMDEFQYLPQLVRGEGFFINYTDNYIFDFFRGITEAFRFGLVVSGSLVGELLDAIDVWHGRFTIFRPRTFPREDSIHMLQTLFRLSGFEISVDIANYIAMSTHDHPYHMQLFGYFLVDQGKIDMKALEEARKKTIDFLTDYYETKIIEARSIDPKAIEILSRAIEGINTYELSNKELEIAIKLERRGFLFRENTKFEIYDPMFRRYIENMLSGRPRKKYIPEYTSEYIVAKHLAYKEGFREVLISYMSWGPFDIVIPRKIGSYSGIGIQVKRTYTGEAEVDEDLISQAEKRKLIPIIALVKMPEATIEFIEPITNKKSTMLRQLIESEKD